MAKILITGATGYIGSHVAKSCLSNGHDVRILTRSNSDLARLESIAGQVGVFRFDPSLQEQSILDSLTGMGGADTIVHCATSHGRDTESDEDILAANVAFPAALLTAAIDLGVGHFVNTDTVLPAETNTYAASKAEFREIAKASTAVGSTRISNLTLELVYGPNDDPRKFATWVTRACLEEGRVIDLTAGTQLRDFVYVDDVVSAYLAVIQSAPSFRWQSWRIGTDHPVSVRHFVEKIHRACGAKATLNFGAVPSRIEPPASPAQQSLSHSGIAWTPEWSIEQGIAALVASERKALASP